MTATWIDQPLPLAFRLGELALGSKTFAVRVREADGSAEPLHPDELTFPLNDWPDALDAMLIRSQPVAAMLPRLTVMRRAIRYVPQQYARCVVDLTGGFDAYLEKFSAKTRSTLRRKVRRLAEAGADEPQWRCFRTPAEMPEFHRLARAVSADTYQERLLDAGLPADDAFLDAMCRDAARDACRGYVLYHERKPAAYLYCPVARGVLRYAYTGYDPAVRGLSPGTVLLYLVLRDLFEEDQHRGFDFTEGDGVHKAFFATGSIRCADIYFFRRSVGNWLILRGHASLDRMSSATGRLLETAGLKSKLKRLLRSRGA